MPTIITESSVAWVKPASWEPCMADTALCRRMCAAMKSTPNISAKRLNIATTVEGGCVLGARGGSSTSPPTTKQRGQPSASIPNFSSKTLDRPPQMFPSGLLRAALPLRAGVPPQTPPKLRALNPPRYIGPSLNLHSRPSARFALVFTPKTLARLP